MTFIKLKCSEKLEEKKKCRATSFLAPSIVCKKQRKLNIKGKDVFVEFYLGGDYKVILATINSWSRSLMSVFQKLKYNNLTIYFIVIYFSKYSTALHFLFSSSLLVLGMKGATSDYAHGQKSGTVWLTSMRTKSLIHYSIWRLLYRFL